jgi:hypothetical protein
VSGRVYDIELRFSIYGDKVFRREPARAVLHAFRWEATSLELVYVGIIRTDGEGFFEKDLDPGSYLMLCHDDEQHSLRLFFSVLSVEDPNNDVFGIAKRVNLLPMECQVTLTFPSQDEELTYLRSTVGNRLRLGTLDEYEKVKRAVYGAIEVSVSEGQATIIPWLRVKIIEW